MGSLKSIHSRRPDVLHGLAVLHDGFPLHGLVALLGGAPQIPKMSDLDVTTFADGCNPMAGMAPHCFVKDEVRQSTCMSHGSPVGQLWLTFFLFQRSQDRPR